MTTIIPSPPRLLLSRLYCTAPLNVDAAVVLDRAQSHYLANVLRKTEGDDVLLFNGVDGEWQAVVAGLDKKFMTMRCLTQTKPQAPLPSLMLVFAPIKKARIDFIAEKATELGVGIIQPMITDRTQMRRVNTKRIEANAIEAAEQTGRTTVPIIRAPTALKSLLEDWPKPRHILFCNEDAAGLSEYNMADQVKGIKGEAAIFIGPEGGFTSREGEMILAQENVIEVSLGGNILRADTAILAALAIWQGVAGAWGLREHERKVVNGNNK
ncbi:MAG: 16S rRNA (uracil(1498)-N(3))-methyltransferase [Candidatus Puniceispirillales bacterium WSBS_2018_MAG_OTU23]